MSNKMVTRDGKTHVVWLDQIHKIYVATYDHAEKTWSDPVFVGDGDDNHAGAALAMDGKGFLYLAYGPHHNPMQHVKSIRANDASQWESLPSFGGVNATYPSLVCDRHDVLHACYRGAYEKERPWGVFYQQRPVGGTWSEPVKLVDPQGPAAYVHLENAIHAPGDDLFVSFHMVRATEQNPQDLRGRGFGVMRSVDGGRTWQAMTGETLVLPVTPDAACVVAYDDGFDVRMGPVACDGSGRPYFSLNRREGSVAETFLYRWRKGWDVIALRPIVEALMGPCAMSDRGVVSLSDDGVLYVACVVCKRGGDWADPSNEVVLLTSHDLGETFQVYPISETDETTSNWLPSLERQAGPNKVDVPQLIYTHGEKGVGCSPDIDTEIRHVFLDEIAQKEQAEFDRAIAGLAEVARLPFSEAQWQQVRGRIEKQSRHYIALRDVPLAYDVEPPLVFSPGKAPRGRKKPFVLSGSSPDVSRPGSNNDLAFLPVTALAALIKQKEISPVELTRLYLDRLTTYGDELKCVVTLTEGLAIKQAQKAEKEIMAGAYRGPLHGIAWGAKDLLATKGIRTTWGATPFKDQVARADATVVQKLRRAGAVLVAKLSLGALASGPTWFEGMTRNPWNSETGASGSSAGPGAATAAGLVGFSIGSETLGSIVAPSYTCGVVGLRPTYGRVSRYGAMALSWTMDKLGPMCRGVEDCAAVFHAIMGSDGKDRSVVDAPFHWEPGADLSGLRVGYLASAFQKEAVGDAPAGLYANALDVMRQLGADLKPVSLPGEYPEDAMSMVLMVEAAAMFDDATLAGDLDVMSEQDKSSWPAHFRAARTVTAVEYLRAQRVRALLIRDMAMLMRDWDVVLAPGMDRSSLTLGNLTGHPVVIVPCGFSEGMPRGLSFMGNLYDEATLLSAASAYEQATEWHTMHPTL
jgi:Asp-tRNA(Asn)/Glu-tRNA(Gln) amidotransferase A subunit family amidase